MLFIVRRIGGGKRGGEIPRLSFAGNTADCGGYFRPKGGSCDMKLTGMSAPASPPFSFFLFQ